ncbi:MAG: DUF2085 domain-containing protein [Chloroflexi bacterium]|nr:DUF2085 domain-containing protein [Chloroflexota bacterium]
MNGSSPSPITGQAASFADWLDRRILGLARHWLLILNLFVFLYVGLPFAAPVLMKAGATGPARLIYGVYGGMCHQLATRSWFLFGQQPVYPRALAGTGWQTLQRVTGVDENDYWAARAFIGNPQVGYKVAFCERDVAIYAGVLLFGLTFALLRRQVRVRPLHVVWWVLLGILPIAVDGFSQLLSWPFNYHILPFVRESTPFLRTLTGGLFGLMNAWLAYPYMEESMRETEDVLAAKVGRNAAHLR